MAPPPHQNLPAARTESARQAAQSFYCDLCGKGYSRQNEFEAHENSYDHQHRKRYKDLKAMNASMANASNAGKSNKEETMVKLTEKGQPPPKKTTPGFRRTFVQVAGPSAGTELAGPSNPPHQDQGTGQGNTGKAEGAKEEPAREKTLDEIFDEEVAAGKWVLADLEEPPPWTEVDEALAQRCAARTEEQLEEDRKEVERLRKEADEFEAYWLAGSRHSWHEHMKPPPEIGTRPKEKKEARR